MASKRRYTLAGITGGKIVSLFDPYPPVVSITRSGYPFCEWLLGDLESNQQKRAQCKGGCSIEQLSYLHALIQPHGKEGGCTSHNLNWNRK